MTVFRPVVAAVAASLTLLAVAGCERRPSDTPAPTTSTPSTTTPSTTMPAPMPPASAASQ